MFLLVLDTILLGRTLGVARLCLVSLVVIILLSIGNWASLWLCERALSPLRLRMPGLFSYYKKVTSGASPCSLVGLFSYLIYGCIYFLASYHPYPIVRRKKYTTFSSIFLYYCLGAPASA